MSIKTFEFPMNKEKTKEVIILHSQKDCASKPASILKFKNCNTYL